MATRLRMPLEYSPMILRSACSWNSSINSRARSLAVGRGKAVHPAHEFQELDAAQTVEEQRFVRHQSDSRFLISNSSPGSLKPRISMLPPSLGNQSGQHPDGRRFPRAVGTEEAEEGSPRHFQVHAIDGGFETVRFSKIAHQDGGGHPSSLRLRRHPEVVVETGPSLVYIEPILGY